MKRKGIVMHVLGEYVPEIIEAMKRAGYKLDCVEPVQQHFIHLEFKPIKK